MFGKAKVQNSDVRKKPTFRTPKFGNSQSLKFHCFGKPKFRIPMFEKSRNLEFQCLEKAKGQNFNVSKSQSLEFQCWEKAKFRIPVFGEAKIWNSGVWIS